MLDEQREVNDIIANRITQKKGSSLAITIFVLSSPSRIKSGTRRCLGKVMLP